jgi:integrase
VFVAQQAVEQMSIRKRVWKSSGETRTAFVVDYVDQSGTRRLKTFRREKDAKAWWATANHEVSQGIHAPAGSKTIESLLDTWIDYCIGENLERTTIEQRKQHARLHINPFLGGEKLANLTTPRVNAFVDQLRDKGRSVAMRRKILTSLSTALAFGKGRGLVAQNVALGVKVRSDERHNGSGPLRAGRDFPTKAELNLLIKNAPEGFRAFIVLAIFSGMRASELRGLRWSDVDLENATIHVSQRADFYGTIGSPKSKAGARDIPLTPLVVNTLKQHKLTNGGFDLVFANSRGRVRPHTDFSRRIWKPLQKKCGMGHYEFHSLSHAAASLFIELGWAPKRIQAVMGHGSITMTFDRYGHLFPQGDVGEDMRRLEAAVVAV